MRVTDKMLLAAFATLLTFGAGAPRAQTGGSPGRDVTLDGYPSGDADSTAAWNAACARIPSAGGVIHLPAGIYLAASAWTCDGKPVVVHGEGRGATTIVVKHPGIGLSLAPGTVANPVTVEGITFRAAASCASAAAVSIRYPLVPSWSQRTATIRDVDALSQSEATSGCRGGSFTEGLVLYGGWAATVDRFTYFGPVAAVPVAATNGISWSNTRALNIRDAVISYADHALYQADYSEGIVITGGNELASNVGLYINTGPTIGAGELNGLSIQFVGNECAVINICVWLTRYAVAYIHDNRIEFGANGTQVAINLVDTKQALVHDNTLQGAAYSTATGIQLQASEGVGLAADNNIHDNQCLNLAVCIRFGMGTTHNVAVNNTHMNGVAGGVFDDAGIGNAMEWITPNGRRNRP